MANQTIHILVSPCLMMNEEAFQKKQKWWMKKEHTDEGKIYSSAFIHSNMGALICDPIGTLSIACIG